MAQTPDPHAGRVVFRTWCIFCHGDQQAGEPPTDFDLGKENPRRFRGYEALTFKEHVSAIVTGYVSEQSGDRNMPSFALRLTPKEIADVAAYERRVMAMSGPYWEENRRSWQKPQKPE